MILATGWPAERVERRVSLRVGRLLLARHARAEAGRFLEIMNIVRGAEPDKTARRLMKVLRPEDEDQDDAAAWIALLARRAAQRGDKDRAKRLERQARLYSFLQTKQAAAAA